MRAVLPLALLLTTGTVPPLTGLAGMPLGTAGPGESAYSGAVARTVKAVIDYTRWPQRHDPLTLCVAGPTQHAAQLGAIRLADGRRVERRNVAAAPAAVGGCHVLYIGQLPVATQRQLTAAVRGKGVLTIAEADPANASEAIIALIYQPRSLSFRLNIDAISRSGLRVDPRVLRISQGGA
jgi:YfiR/HmsC-like